MNKGEKTMKFYPKNKKSSLPPDLLNQLSLIRKEKDFQPKEYLKNKSDLINKYFKQHGLSSAVIALSGGVDSALTLAILNDAKSQKNSPIKKIYPILLPSYSNGATDQDFATTLGKNLCSQLEIEEFKINIEDIQEKLKEKVDETLNISGNTWAEGQLVAYLRTPIIYYITSLLSQEKFSGVICGTTNFDEGKYLGYFGKASDGLVDLQIISDLHKSEVFTLGNYLKLPSEILNRVPQGDMYDGRSDEEVFGASYDFVELYLNFLSWPKSKQLYFMENLNNENLKFFKEKQKNIEDLHRYNKHKYLGASPAVHLDIFNLSIPNGWRTFNYE